MNKSVYLVFMMHKDV